MWSIKLVSHTTMISLITINTTISKWQMLTRACSLIFNVVYMILSISERARKNVSFQHHHNAYVYIYQGGEAFSTRPVPSTEAIIAPCAMCTHLPWYKTPFRSIPRISRSNHCTTCDVYTTIRSFSVRSQPLCVFTSLVPSVLLLFHHKRLYASEIITWTSFEHEIDELLSSHKNPTISLCFPLLITYSVEIWWFNSNVQLFYFTWTLLES